MSRFRSWRFRESILSCKRPALSCRSKSGRAHKQCTWGPVEWERREVQDQQPSAPENQNYWELAIALSKLRTAGDYPQNRPWNRSMPTLRSAPCWEGMHCKLSFPKRPGKLHHSKKSSLAYCTPYTFRVCMQKDHRWNGSTSLHQTSTKRRVQHTANAIESTRSVNPKFGPLSS